MRLYVASSRQNTAHDAVVENLRLEEHEVFDYRSPHFGPNAEAGGFPSWEAIDPDFRGWTPDQVRQGLEHPTALRALSSDLQAIAWAEALVLVTPSGPSSHFELGFAVAQAKPTFVLLVDGVEPELVHRAATWICVDAEELLGRVAETERRSLTNAPQRETGWLAQALRG